MHSCSFNFRAETGHEMRLFVTIIPGDSSHPEPICVKFTVSAMVKEYLWSCMLDVSLGVESCSFSLTLIRQGNRSSKVVQIPNRLF